MSPFRCIPFSSDSKWTPGRRKRKLTSRKGHRQQAPSSPMDLPKASCCINWKSQNCSLFFPPSPGTHFSAKLSVQSEYFLSLDVMPVSSLFLYDFMILTLTLQSLPRCKRNSFYNKNFYNCVRNSKKKPHRVTWFLLASAWLKLFLVYGWSKWDSLLCKTEGKICHDPGEWAYSQHLSLSSFRS